VLKVKLPKPIAFEWDKWNIDKNWRKHKVSQKECEEIFFNKLLKIFPDEKHSKSEARFLALGRTKKERKLTIIFTIRESKIRTISARDQNKKEKEKYEKSK